MWFKRAPCSRSEERSDQISEVSARSPILEQNQKRHRQRGHDELHEYVERNPKHMRVSTYKVRKQIHQGREREHQNQVFEFEAQEGDLSMQIAMNRRQFETHSPTLPLRAPA